jgi:hypothetical protein
MMVGKRTKKRRKEKQQKNGMKNVKSNNANVRLAHCLFIFLCECDSKRLVGGFNGEGSFSFLGQLNRQTQTRHRQRETLIELHACIRVEGGGGIMKIWEIEYLDRYVCIYM